LVTDSWCWTFPDKCDRDQIVIIFCSSRKKIMQFLSVILSCVLVLANGQQRTAPGVNPSQYQQPPPPQQQQQFQGGQHQQFQQQPPPQQFQGQPPPQQQQQFQQGQVPQQQFQQPPPQQQQFQQPPPQQQFQQPPPQQQQFQGGQPQQHPPQHGHKHQKKVLHKDMNEEKEHMAEHMDVPIDTSNMSEQELQFHYFKMHDADGNNKLDGCELVKSLIHWHDHSNHDKESDQPLPEEKIFKDDELVNMIDPILATDDKNHDGFIDYPEFVMAQQAASARS